MSLPVSVHPDFALSLAGTKEILCLHKREWAKNIPFCSFMSHWGFVKNVP